MPINISKVKTMRCENDLLGKYGLQYYTNPVAWIDSMRPDSKLPNGYPTTPEH